MPRNPSKLRDHFEAGPAYNKPAEAEGAPHVYHFNLCWHGDRIGSFAAQGDELRWEGYSSHKYEKLFTQRPEDGMPYFLVNMHPDNKLFELLEQDEQITYIAGGLRYLCNLVISRNAPFDLPVMKDRLQTDFDRYVADGTFIGAYTGPFPNDNGEDLQENLKEYWRNRYVPRFSGAEVKLPATLHEFGVLQPAITTPFTHIIKFPTDSGKEGWGFNEWMCLELSEAAGLRTAKHALLSLGKDKPPAVLVERFDIPHNARSEDHNWFLIQDFCTLAELSPDERGRGSMEQVAKVLRQHSTNPQADLEDLYRRTVLSVAINDGDMHRKNIAMLFEYNPQKEQYVNVRLSPTYDVTSEIWQYDSEQKQTLSVQGKTSGIKAKTLIAFGKTIGLSEDRAHELMEDVTSRVAARAVEIARNLPQEAAKYEACRFTANRIATIAVKAAGHFGGSAPAWENVEAPKATFKMVNGQKTFVIQP